MPCAHVVTWQRWGCSLLVHFFAYAVAFRLSQALGPETVLPPAADAEAAAPAGEDQAAGEDLAAEAEALVLSDGVIASSGEDDPTSDEDSDGDGVGDDRGPDGGAEAEPIDDSDSGAPAEAPLPPPLEDPPEPPAPPAPPPPPAGDDHARGEVFPPGSATSPWRIARIAPKNVFSGWGARCRCHVDVGKVAECKKSLHINSDEARRRVMKWLLVGAAIDPNDGNAKAQHLAINPRSFPLPIESEEELIAQARVIYPE